MTLTFGDLNSLPPDEAFELEAFLPFRLSAAAEAVARLMQRTGETRFGLSIPASRALCATAEAGVISDADLGRATRLDLGAAALARAELAERGLLARDGQARSNLTDAGGRLYADLVDRALAAEAALLSGLAPEDVRALHRLLPRLEAAALKLSGAAP